MSARDRWLGLILVSPKGYEALKEMERALKEIADLPNLSRDPKDDFDKGARAARLDAADIATKALKKATQGA